jgi:hypothetical protein
MHFPFSNRNLEFSLKLIEHSVHVPLMHCEQFIGQFMHLPSISSYPDKQLFMHEPLNKIPSAHCKHAESLHLEHPISQALQELFKRK